jgi:hypothetical protein
MSTIRLLGLTALLTPSPTLAADSGPAADSAVAPFSVYAVAGEVENQTVDFVAKREGKPTIYCFIPKDKWSRPSARLLKTLDDTIDDVAAEGALVAVWVTDDPAASKEYLPKAQQSLQLSRTALTVYEQAATGPAEWGINTDVHLTIVATKDGKVRKSFAFMSANETDAEAVLATLK